MLIKELYSIQSFTETDGMVQASVKLNRSHEVFKGHFPGNPIMPGVCTIQIVKELTEKALDKKLFLSVVSNVKFISIINPEKNETIQVVLNISEEEDAVKVKNTVSYEHTLALKLNATFKVLS
ncbi:3-hydroxyacyl-[acyl-carrier-protein] dehydratase [Pricia antarctica]|uniref:3-hydroxyacyl-[acyl-carrier-protein] dehydratase n=1 Tax=Pricia antarctica TaxID=641691 RepID=A0A1G6WC21_9FLAO|nr:3-hydroxyacyl-ACP dehydratase [Pricia antarctica]SDD63344.1 3-hydroxyacyl-[acyl-carrier-protein] dehydratase [Pricia antarctica]